MSVLTRNSVKVALGCVVVLGLTACDNIEIIGAEGQGNCGGSAVTLTTSQDGPGEVLTINYTGPSTSDMSLFLAHGFYGDTDPLDPSDSGPGSIAFGDSDGVSEAYALKLDVTDPGWTTAGSGGATTYSFTGSIEDLIDNGETYGSLGGGIETDVFNAIMPAFIGVDCDETATTGVVTNSWAVAQPVFPNTMLINGFEIVSSEPVSGGAVVTFSYPADALTAFGTFTPFSPVVMSVFVDDPNVANDSVENMWFQGIMAGDGPSAGFPVDNGDGTFSVTVTDDPLADGDYLIISFIPNAKLADGSIPDEYKVVFTGLRYSSDSGFSLYSLNFLPPLQSSPVLSDTGVDPIGIAGALAIGLTMVAAGTVAVLRRRATHT